MTKQRRNAAHCNTQRNPTLSSLSPKLSLPSSKKTTHYKKKKLTSLAAACPMNPPALGVALPSLLRPSPRMCECAAVRDSRALDLTSLTGTVEAIVMRCVPFQSNRQSGCVCVETGCRYGCRQCACERLNEWRRAGCFLSLSCIELSVLSRRSLFQNSAAAQSLLRISIVIEPSPVIRDKASLAAMPWCGVEVCG